MHLVWTLHTGRAHKRRRARVKVPFLMCALLDRSHSCVPKWLRQVSARGVARRHAVYYERNIPKTMILRLHKTIAANCNISLHQHAAILQKHLFSLLSIRRRSTYALVHQQLKLSVLRIDIYIHACSHSKDSQ